MRAVDADIGDAELATQFLLEPGAVKGFEEYQIGKVEGLLLDGPFHDALKLRERLGLGVPYDFWLRVTRGSGMVVVVVRSSDHRRPRAIPRPPHSEDLTAWKRHLDGYALT
ncbi:hypothetical protein O9K51_06296 [Purpureocillium lavendulum]|uniref:Uncharacterized protein n=1 Tax=Purpureocillium lavendulum TaxID=1247861 RepID=A0AB34FNS8_9HYPO|nr:hypothetical protein O9K51_06296 [Purpureocillium lavendulum]